jgi:hypothetical protein
VSALRTMLAALWAAVWVRWKLLSVRVRRAFGGSDPAAAGSGYYLSASEIPVEGVDYDLSELPPELVAGLELARGELLDRARAGAASPARRPRAGRRRTVGVAVASLLALGAAGAGASALVTGTTGVPAVDHLLGIHEQNRPGGGLQPDSAAGSSSVELSTPDGQRFVSTSYVSKDDRLCRVITDVVPGKPGGFGCVDPVFVTRSLERTGGLLAGLLSNGNEVLITGFVRPDVVAIDATGPDGSAEVKLGPEWSPGLAGIDSLKPFLAIAGHRPDRELDNSDYEIHAVTETGQRFRIAP